MMSMSRLVFIKFRVQVLGTLLPYMLDPTRDNLSSNSLYVILLLQHWGLHPVMYFAEVLL